jgi:peptidoglycan/LPS O-acetylase OafA/YrhL
MTAYRKFAITSSLALLLPLVMLVISELRVPTIRPKDALLDVAVNYAMLVFPQALAIFAALFRPHLRGRFLQVFLVPTTLILLAFEALMTFGSDPNAGMFYVFYLIVPLIMLIVALYVTPSKASGTES